MVSSFNRLPQKTHFLLRMLVFCSILFSGESKTENLQTRVSDAVKKVVYLDTKKISHKLPLQFGQAVHRYVSYTKLTHLKQINSDTAKKTWHEKELLYLFDQFVEQVSLDRVVKLLMRARSAHQQMVQKLQPSEKERGEQYEQVCSVLLLRCAQVLSNYARVNLLDALEEIDTLLVYWRDQKNHPIKYFFGKSPFKWLLGKGQEQEINDNIAKLEHRQIELFIVLGKLTEHVHAFAQRGNGYAACYSWIEELLSVLSCIRIKKEPVIVDASVFDKIASQLEGKLKQVFNLKKDSLSVISSAQKSHYFVRKWMVYTTLLAIAGYTGHYCFNHQNAVNEWIGSKAFSGYFKSMKESYSTYVVNPTRDVLKAIFGENQWPSTKDSELILEAHTKQLEAQNILREAKLDVADLVQKADIESTRVAMFALLNKMVIDTTLTEKSLKEIVDAEARGNVVPFQSLVNRMPKHLVGNMVWSDDVIQAFVVLAELKIYHYGVAPLQVVMELIFEHGMPLISEVFKVLARGNAEWDAISKKLSIILNVAILTPTVIGGWMGYNGLNKAYQWSIAKDYSPIRIALTDINSLFIESVMPLDDQDYGKLVYLIHKLRNKAQCQVPTKDNARTEFLADIGKLELKNFTVTTKRNIIENMFHKYLFLGCNVKSA